MTFPSSRDPERDDREEKSPRNIFKKALGAGAPARVAALIETGTDIGYRDANGYDALIDAVHGRDVLRDPRLLELLDVLVRHGVRLSGVTAYHESGLRVLSRIGRFDAVHFLLQAGADPSHLNWTPLIQAVALGSLDEMENLIRNGAPLEERDHWNRTAWLVAIQGGDIAKADLLRCQGANTRACGRCCKPPLFYAIENHHVAMLRWLLEAGLDPEQTDEFGTTSLITAAEADDADCVEALIAAGVEIDRVHNGGTALRSASSRPVALLLLAAGADPAGLSNEGRRALAGLSAVSTDPLLGVGAEQFQRAATRRFGTANPERFREPFWEAMIRAGVSAFEGRRFFGAPGSSAGAPGWSADRFGQSVTLLPDGRAVQIAGEHEDHYDPDFCIYNDVFVHHPDGSIEIFGYPETIFPPTDFHTATLVDDAIYVIGSLGYGRDPMQQTPVFRLDVSTFAITRLQPTGESPGWIHGHRATLSLSREIIVEGGKVVTAAEGEQAHADNSQTFILDLQRMQWRRTTPPGTPRRE